MSTTIENQVVSMQFDNKHFESNVQTSLSTLDKLKKSLKFPGAAKSFDDISASAKKVNLSPLGGAVEKVGLKFNAMYTMADQALRNITNRAQQTAENVVKSFTIDPVKMGFQEYETQLNAVQTILANTQSKGENLYTVNAALDELNTYADQTIYNFTEMTRNIGTFTAAGVGLKESTNAIKGIANLAAVSGSNAQQASTAMYQLSQALAAGKVSLMDWNSVVNAGMGGELFQEALKRTARNLGTGVDEAIKKFGTFRESLTQGEWLTKEVLTETLAQLSGAYTEADLIAQGYTEEQAKQIAQLAETASDAATKVKTFTQLMDTLKESAQSGWTSTWELLVGDFEEAKELWTNISEVVGGFIGKSADRRNTILGGALNNNWEKLIDKINKAGVETTKFEERVKSVAKAHNIDIDKIIEKHGSLEDAFRKGAVSTDILKEALGGLTAAGDKVKNIDLSGITKTLKVGQTSEDIKKVEEALLALGYSLTGKDGKFYGDDGYFGTLTEEAIREFQKANGLKVDGVIGPDTLKALDEAVNKTKELDENAVGATESFDDLIDSIGELGGREKLIQSFTNIFKGLNRILTPIGEAFNSAFGLDNPQELSNKLFGVIEKFQQSTAKFNRWTRTKEGKSVIDGLTNAFKGFLSVVKLVGTVVGGIAKGAFKIFGKILSTVGIDVIKLAGNIGKGITKFQEWITESGVLSGILSKLASSIGTGIEKIRNWIKAFFELPQVQANLKKFKMEFSGIIDIIKGRFGDAIERFKEFVGRLKEMDGFSLENIKTAFSDFFNNVLGPLWKNEDGSTIFDGLINSVKNLWSNGQKYFDKIGTALGKFGTAIATFFSTIKEWVGNNAGGLLALASLVSIFFIFKKLADFIGVIAEPLGSFGELAEEIGKGVKRLSKAVSFKLKTEAVKNIATAVAILTGSLVALTLVDHTKLAGATAALVVVIASLGGLLWALGKFSDNIGDVTKLALSMFTLSGALMVFALAAKVIAGLDEGALGKTAVVLAGVFGLVFAISKLTEGSLIDFASFGKMMLGLSAGLLLLSVAVGILGRMNTATLVKGMAAVGTFFVMIAGMMIASRALKRDTPRFAVTMNGLAAALLIMSIAVGILGKMEYETLIKGVAAVGAFLVMMAGLMVASRVLKKDMPHFGATMLGLSTGLLAMAFAVKAIAGIKTGDLVKGGAVIAVFLAMMVAMMAATRMLTKHSANAGKIGAMMLSFATSMILLTGAIAVLAMIDLSDLAKAVGAIGLVGGIFAGMIALTKYAKVGKGVKTTIITMAAAVGVLAISIAALSFVDPSKLMGASAALGIIMGMFALMSYTAKAIGIGGIASVLVLTGIVALLGYIISELSDIPADGALKVSTALSALILSLSASCLILGAVGSMGPAAFIGIGVLAALLAVIGIFAAIAIASLPAIGTQLSSFMDNLSGFIAGATKITPEVGTGIKNLSEAILILTSANLINGLTSLLGWGSLSEFGNQLSAFGTGLAGFLSAVSGATSGVAGNDGEVSSINWDNVDKAVGAAVKLSEVASKIPDTSGLSTVFAKKDLGVFGDQIADFASGLGSYLTAVSGKFTKLNSAGEVEEVTIDWDNVDKATGVADKLATLAGKIPDTSGFNTLFAKKDLGEFGDQIAKFAGSLATYLALVSGKFAMLNSAGEVEEVTINWDNATKATTIATDLANIAASIPDTSGWSTAFEKKDLGEFGTQIANFASGLGSYLAAVSGKFATLNSAGEVEEVTVNWTNVDKATGIAGKLADAAAKIPDTSGWSVDTFGKKDLGAFGTQIASFATSLVTYLTTVGGKFTTLNEAGNVEEVTVDWTKIDKAVTVAVNLAGLAEKIPDTSGWSTIFGKKDLGEFGTQVSTFASGISGFITSLNTAFPSGSKVDIDFTMIESVVGVANQLAEMSKTVGENSAGWQWLTGEDGLDTFGTKIETLGTKLASFCSSVSDKTFDVDAISDAIFEIEKMVGLAERMGGEKVGNLKDLGSQIEAIGQSLGTFSFDTAGLDASKFSAIATGLSSLASIDIDNADNVEDFIDCLGDIGTEGVEKFIASFKDSTPKVLAAISAMMTSAVLVIKIKGLLVKAAVKTLVSEAADASYSTIAVLKFMSAGYSMAEGFAKGISSGTFLAVAKASAMASLALAAAKAVLKINSPSKVFIPVGEAVPEGFAMGIGRLSGLVRRTTESMADDAIDGTKNAISRIADIVNMDIDTQPTIRPVLDLSEVESGIGGINGLFGMRPSLGVMSNIRSINSMMSDRQNEANSDVVSAIKDLGRRIDNASGDTFNVNGITYDDGSNVTNAVKALIRGVKVERRK